MTALCVNGRHHHRARQGASCDRPLPTPPLVHRAVGATAVAAVVGLGAAFVIGWRLADTARQRAADRWCEVLG